MTGRSLSDRNISFNNARSGASLNSTYFVSGNVISGNSLYDCITALGASGEYVFNTLHTGRIPVEFIRVSSSTTYSSNTSLGDATPDTRMLIVQYDGDLTINSGVTVSPTTRKRGFVIVVKGIFTLNGTISMAARGARAPGDRLLLVQSHEIPASGGAGGPGANGTVYDNPGTTGVAGTSGSSGGGGGGGKGYGLNLDAVGGSGTAGTSYSGGSGGGGAGHGSAGENAFAYAGPGGVGSHGGNIYGGGGAGNPGGPGGANTTAYGGRKGEDGTPGTLVIFAETTISGTGSIVASGNRGNNTGDSWSTGGGGTGGGSVNIFFRTANTFTGTINVTGGVRGTWASIFYRGGNTRPGGDGGSGSWRIQQF